MDLRSIQKAAFSSPQTDARNDANGRAGTKKHGLAELGNRAFLNRITKVQIAEGNAKPEFFDLEPLPPNDPKPDDALATPYAIRISDDDNTLVATAAGSDRVFTVDAKTGKVLGRAEVGEVPAGLPWRVTIRKGIPGLGVQCDRKYSLRR